MVFSFLSQDEISWCCLVICMRGLYQWKCGVVVSHRQCSVLGSAQLQDTVVDSDRTKTLVAFFQQTHNWVSLGFHNKSLFYSNEESADFYSWLVTIFVRQIPFHHIKISRNGFHSEQKPNYTKIKYVCYSWLTNLKIKYFYLLLEFNNGNRKLSGINFALVGWLTRTKTARQFVVY